MISDQYTSLYQYRPNKKAERVVNNHSCEASDLVRFIVPRVVTLGKEAGIYSAGESDGDLAESELRRFEGYDDDQLQELVRTFPDWAEIEEAANRAFDNQQEECSDNNGLPHQKLLNLAYAWSTSPVYTGFEAFCESYLSDEDNELFFSEVADTQADDYASDEMQ